MRKGSRGGQPWTMVESQRRPHVLAIPFPAQGHMFSLLDLACILSERFGFTVTVAVTPANLPLLSRHPAASPLVIPFPSHPSLPPGLENTKDLARSQYLFLFQALAGLHGPLLSWARSRPDTPDVILSDIFLGWTTRLAAEMGIPRLVFSPCGGLGQALFNSLWRDMPQRSNLDDPDEPISFPSLPRRPVYPWRELSVLWRRYKCGDPAFELIREGILANMESWGLVLNTFAELEGPYIDHLRNVDLGHPRVWAVGPLLPSLVGGAQRGGPSSVAVEKVADWLDGCDVGTVVYVAFGSQAELLPVQEAILDAGLERSGARFVWAVTSGGGRPEGIEERAAGRGLVIRGWAPQPAILAHRAVGAFLTHCGWNSIQEAMATGVTLLTWPMYAEQFSNARLVEEEAGVGLRVCGGGPGGVPDPDELALAVAGAVGEEGRGRRERAKAWAARARSATDEGGSSYQELEKLVEHLSALAVKSKRFN